MPADDSRLLDLRTSPEEVLWRPDLQQAKRSQNGAVNVRYRNQVKADAVATLREVITSHAPWLLVRHILTAGGRSGVESAGRRRVPRCAAAPGHANAGGVGAPGRWRIHVVHPHSPGRHHRRRPTGPVSMS
jgi:hypothetical protein